MDSEKRSEVRLKAVRVKLSRRFITVIMILLMILFLGQLGSMLFEISGFFKFFSSLTLDM